MAECPTCGRDDFASRRGMKYHHATVHNESLDSERTTVTLTCEQCGNNYERRKDRAEESKFCSASCQRKGRSTRGKEREERSCSVCGNTFSCHPNDDQRFCSTDCFHSWRTEYMSGEDSPIAGEKVTVTCSTCGKDFQKRPSEAEIPENHYCSHDCYYENYSGEDAPRWKGGAESYYGPTWESQRRKAIERDNERCQDCGMTRDEHYDEHDRDLEVHHKTPIRTFSDTEEANQLSNLITLCTSCHMERENREASTQNHGSEQTQSVRPN